MINFLSDGPTHSNIFLVCFESKIINPRSKLMGGGVGGGGGGGYSLT